MFMGFLSCPGCLYFGQISRSLAVLLDVQDGDDEVEEGGVDDDDERRHGGGGRRDRDSTATKALTQRIEKQEKPSLLRGSSSTQLEGCISC